MLMPIQKAIRKLIPGTWDLEMVNGKWCFKKQSYNVMDKVEPHELGIPDP